MADFINKDIENAGLTEYLDYDVLITITRTLHERFPNVSLKNIVIILVVGEFFASKYLCIEERALEKSYVVKVPSNIFKYYTFVYSPHCPKQELAIVEIQHEVNKERFFGLSCYFPGTWFIK